MHKEELEMDGFIKYVGDILLARSADTHLYLGILMTALGAFGMWDFLQCGYMNPPFDGAGFNVGQFVGLCAGVWLLPLGFILLLVWTVQA